MPIPAHKRDYKKELREETPARRKARILRKRARRAVIKDLGEAAVAGKHVDHKKPLSKGGSNTRSNLRVLSATANMKRKRK